MFVLTVLALAAVAVLLYAISGSTRPGRHQRSPMGPVLGDGSGLTEEGVATNTGGSQRYRGPEDDPEFLAQLNRLKRPEPPSDL